MESYRNKVLYKYRGFNDFEFALDIVINQRLYAAHFKSLNDPMEGRFRYSPKQFEKHYINQVLSEKNEIRILSLSASPDNHLLWSYYADGHAGFVVGVKIIDSNLFSFDKVTYVNDFKPEDLTTEGILSMKHATWQHENEFRVLKKDYVPGSPFVQVEITDIIFGKKSNLHETKVNLMKQLIHKLYPENDIDVRTITHEEIKGWVDGELI